MEPIMDQATLAAFESRAAAAEQRLAVLETKLGKGQHLSRAPSSAAMDVSQYVAALKDLRGLLVAAQEQQGRLEKELVEATAAQKQLETENSKLKYQVKHLKWAVQEGDSKLAVVTEKQ